MEDNDVQLQIKKRARRRLVGAVFFVSVVAVVLPMVMDNEPRQVVQDVEIRIPGQDEKTFAPKFSAAPVPADAAAPEKPVPETVKPAEPPAPVAPPPEKPASPAPAPLADKVAAAPVAPAAAKPTARVLEVLKDNDKKPEKLGDKPLLKPEKPLEKPAAKTDKASTKPEKPAEKPAAKNEKSDKPADKQTAKSDSKADAKPDAKAEEAKRAAAILAGSGDAKPAAKSAESKGGEYLVLIGAFANEANVKSLKGKLGEQGIKTFSEPLDTPQGKKTRLRAGPFPNREAAEKALERMRKIGVAGVVAVKQ